MPRKPPKYPDWRWGNESGTRQDVLRGVASMASQYIDETDGGLAFDRHGRAYGFSVQVFLVPLDGLDDLDPRLVP